MKSDCSLLSKLWYCGMWRRVAWYMGPNNRRNLLPPYFIIKGGSKVLRNVQPCTYLYGVKSQKTVILIQPWKPWSRKAHYWILTRARRIQSIPADFIYFRYLLILPWIYGRNHLLKQKELTSPIIMGSGFDDWIYWQFFTITVTYYSSQSVLTAEASLHFASRSMTASTFSKSESKSHFDWQSVSLSVLVSSPRCFFLFESYCPIHVGRPLWREVGAVICQS
jgi:hypothetical protein